jgi:hypothetical protein
MYREGRKEVSGIRESGAGSPGNLLDHMSRRFWRKWLRVAFRRLLGDLAYQVAIEIYL